MKRLLLLIGILGCLGVGALITLIVSRDVRVFVKLHTVYHAYNAWKHQGGPWRWEYNEGFMQDHWRDEAVRGLTVAELRRKFPFLIDGSTYPEDSDRRMVLDRERDERADAGILWFDAPGQSVMAIRTIAGIGESFQLYKG